MAATSRSETRNMLFKTVLLILLVVSPLLVSGLPVKEQETQANRNPLTEHETEQKNIGQGIFKRSAEIDGGSSNTPGHDSDILNWILGSLGVMVVVVVVGCCICMFCCAGTFGPCGCIAALLGCLCCCGCCD